MSTPNVDALAAKGVDVIPGEHVLTANTPAEYVDAILRLLENHEERKRFSEAGRARVLSHHNWVVSRAARAANVNRSTFDARMKKLGKYHILLSPVDSWIYTGAGVRYTMIHISTI